MHPRSLSYALLFLIVALIPGGAATQESTGKSEINAFYQSVISSLATQPRPTYPVEAETLVTFTVADDGTIADASVAQSSGSDPLDETALQIVRNAAPFPPPPEGAKRDLSITIKSTRPTLSFGN